MIKFKWLFKIINNLLLIVCSVCAANVSAETITQNSTGMYDGYFYSFSKVNGDASITLLGNGRYQSQWGKDTREWIGGVGWSKGGRKVVEYSGTYLPDAGTNSHLALYGWTRNPFVEYFIIESYGAWNPSDGSKLYGSFDSNGVTYDVYYREMPLKGINPVPFYRYFSVRRDIKPHGDISGTINTGDHFDAWASMGLNLGEQDYMIMATWGYQGSGHSDITVAEHKIDEPSTVPAGENGTASAGGIDLWFIILLFGGGFGVRKVRGVK